MPDAGGIILKWPENTLAYVVTAASVILFFAVLVYIIVRVVYQEQSRRTDDWSRIYKWALKSKLSGREMKFLQTFVYSRGVKERRILIESRRRFKELFIQYLIDANDDVRLKINLMGKLFPELETPSEIISSSDLHMGEFVMLEYDEAHHFCKIASIKENNEIHLLSFGRKIIQIPDEFPVSLYAYRRGHGAYLLACHVKNIHGRSAVLVYDGRVDFLGKIHLMAELEIGFELRPFPELYLKEDLFRKAEEEGVPPPDLTLRLHGETSRISDRAMRFRFVYRGVEREDPLLSSLKFHVDADQTLMLDEVILHRQERWQVIMTLPTGYVFQCEGKIISDMRHKGYHLFRFENISSDSEKALIYEIKKAGAVPEKLV